MCLKKLILNQYLNPVYVSYAYFFIRLLCLPGHDYDYIV